MSERDDGRAYVRRVRRADEALSVLGVDIRKPEAIEQVEIIRDALRLVDFFFSHEALVRLPPIVFQGYINDPERQYNRGEVIAINECKYLIQNWGRIDSQPRIEGDQVQPSLCKLFRDSGRYDWVKEEYCAKGFERFYNGEWYRVISSNVDSGTPPPNDYQNWEKL